MPAKKPWLLYLLSALASTSRSIHGLSPHYTPTRVLPTATTAVRPNARLLGPVIADSFTMEPSAIKDHQFLLAESSPLLPQTQAQQMSDAMALKTLQGTKWRLFLDLPNTNSQPQQPQSLTLIFQGFVNEPNKGIVQLTNGIPNDPPTTGRWLSKPSEIRRGTVQLSARWKIKVTGDKAYIFKGFIRAAPTLSTGGSTVEAQMVGTLLSVDTEETVGKFRADLIAINISEEELRM